MKKILAIVLALACVLSLFACAGGGGGGDAASKVLQVGYARKDIMPDGQVRIAGSGNNAHRISTGYLDYLYATCIALSQGGNTVLLFSTDALSARIEWTEEARAMISQETGVPENNIHIASTHCHSAPQVGGEDAMTAAWKPIYMGALLTTAKKAIEDQAPTTMYGQHVQTEQTTFIRHYKMADGSYAGSNFGDMSKGIVDYSGTPDEQMVLIKMDREGDKKDILLMNFQAHPCWVDTKTNYYDLSADYIGVARDVIEEQTGMQFIYFLGATGNQNSTSSISGDQIAKTKQDYGKRVAQYAIDALPNITEKIEDGEIRVAQKDLEHKSNDYGQDRLAEAKLVHKKYTETGDSALCNDYARSLGFQSVFECNGIVNCSTYPATQTMELGVVRIGQLGFVAAPYEMFAEQGTYIKENSPFKYTVVSTCTNAYNNYFPTKEAFAYGCYESFTARFASGVAETVADEFVNMLKSLN